MKYKRMVFAFILCFIFLFEFIILNRNYFPYFKEQGEEIIKIICSGYAGYNYIQSHATIYLLLYLFFSIQFMPNILVQYVIRKSRKKYIRKNFISLLKSAFLFACCIAGMLTLGIAIFCNGKMLLEKTFLGVILLWVIALFVYYTFVGSIFQMYSVMFMSKMHAIVFTFITSVSLTIVQGKIGLWSPVLMLDVFDLFFAKELKVFPYMMKLGVSIIMISIIYIATCSLFQEKDILHENT